MSDPMLFQKLLENCPTELCTIITNNYCGKPVPSKHQFELSDNDVGCHIFHRYSFRLSSGYIYARKEVLEASFSLWKWTHDIDGYPLRRFRKDFSFLHRVGFGFDLALHLTCMTRPDMLSYIH